MVVKRVFASGALLLLPVLAAAQVGEQPAAPLKKVQKVEKAPPPAQVPEQEVRELVKALGSEDAQERERAQERLEGLGPAVLPHLGRILGETTDPVLWDRIHRALVRISGVQEGPGPGARPLPGPPGSLEGMIQEMEARMRRLFGELEGRLDQLPGLPAPGAQGEARESSVQVQIGPEGVEVKVTRRDESGKEQVQHYKAKDVEEFQRLYPEIARTYGIGSGGMTFRFGPGGPPGELDQDLEGLLDRLRGLFGRRRSPAIPPWRQGFPPLPVPPGRDVPEPVPPPPGERLGVVVRELSEDLADYLGLKPGHGLLVEQVVDGTLALRAGLKPRDILLSVGGREVVGIKAIQEALRSVPGGGAVEIVVLRGGEKLRLKAAKDEVPDGAGRIKELRRA